MSKKESIATIEEMYPIDSQYPDTNEVGRQLLLESIQEANFNWRDLPEEVLAVWSRKCIEKENESIRRFNEKIGYK